MSTAHRQNVGQDGLVRTQAAFTMIEIAISLAVIGFALVAIIGILPTAMNVQKDNRHETIVNQDNSIFMGAIRNGERGMDDLTNYVLAITNYQTVYNPRGVPTRNTYGYTYTVSTLNGARTNPQWLLTNGFSIVGLLSTPQIIHLQGGFASNHVVALVRSISGSAAEKTPQTNSTVQDFALSYRLFPTLVGFGTNFYDPSWTNFADNAIAGNTNLIANRLNYMILTKYYETNMHELRLTYRWPVLPNGNSGPGRQVFRTLVDGPYTNDPPGSPYFFVQPNVYFKGS